MARAPRSAAARLGRNSPCLVFLLLLLAQHACLVAGQAWRVLPAGYGVASSPPPAPSPRRLGGMPRSGAGSSEEGAAMPVPAQSAVTSGGAVGGAFTSAALPVKPTPAAAVLPAAAAVAAVTQPRARATPAAVTPPVDNDALSSSDAVYAPIATLPPQTTTVREANGDTVSTTKTVTEEVPLSRLTAGLFQQAAAAKGGVARAAVPSTTTEATSDVPRGGGVERIIERVPVPVPVPVKAPATVAAKATPAKKPPPPVAAAASPPPPPPPVTAELTNVPTPLDLVQAHQAAMQAVGGGRFIVNRTALEEALSGAAVAPTPATTSPHSGSSKGPTRASGHTPAKAPPAKKAAPAPQEKVARRHGFAYWAGLWFLLLLMCLCVSVLARGSRGGPVFAPNMWGQASQAAQDGLKWVSTSAGAYGSTSSQAPPGRASAPVRASSERVRGEREGKSGHHHGKGKYHHSSKGDKRRGAKEDDLAPEEYMMTSLRSDRSAASAPSSDAGGGERRQVDLGGHRSAPSLTASGGSAAPPWEQLYRDAPTVATTPAVDVLKAMGKGKKGTQVARSWVPGDAAGRPQLKCLVQADKEGVFVAWQESRLGPSQRVQVHSVLGALDTLTVTLDTASGDMKVHPADVEGRALWVLGLNAAFHAHSAALAAATRGDWDVSAAELEAAVIGLPWHPAVYLAASQGAMATAVPAAEAVQPPSSGRHRGHPVAPPQPSLRDDGRMLDAL